MSGIVALPKVLSPIVGSLHPSCLVLRNLALGKTNAIHGKQENIGSAQSFLVLFHITFQRMLHMLRIQL